MNVVYEKMTGVEVTRRMAVTRLATGDGNVWVYLASDGDTTRVLVSTGTEGERPQVQVVGLGYRDGAAAQQFGQLLVEAGALALEAEQARALVTADA